MKINLKSIKIIILSALGLTAALTCALIPINVYCADFPEWVPVFLSVIFCGGLIAYLIFFKTKLITKIILPAVFLIVALVCSSLPYLLPYWNSYVFKDYNGVIMNYDETIQYSAAAEDLNALKHYLKKTHPKFKDGLSEEVENAFNASLEKLQNEETITVNGLRREIQSVLHFIGDAHTTTYNSFGNDTYLKAIPKKYSEGYSIAGINGKKVKQILEDAKPYFCYESEDWIDFDLGSLATLDFLNYSKPFKYEWSNGTNVVYETYSANDFVSWEEFVEIRSEYFTPSEQTDFVYYEIDKQKSFAVLTLTECEYNQAYIDCVNSMFTEAKENNIRNIAVDLRGNGGGSSLVANEFIKYLPVDRYSDISFDWRWGFLNFHSDGETINNRYDNLTFEGNVYVLTDSLSFSSAKDFAMLIQDNNLGKVIGAPSSNSANGYGEVAYFYLPNTGIFVQISTKKWYRIDKNNSDDFVIPDYMCESDECIKKLYEIIS